MPSLCGVFTVQIVLTERKTKDKSYYFFFPSVVKNNGRKKKKALRREKCVAQIFRKDFTERKAERTTTGK